MRSVIACMNALKNSKNIAIFCHTLPDADALGSAVALKKLIRQYVATEDDPKQVDIFVDAEDISEVNAAIIKNVQINVQNCEKYDISIAVDCASLSRMGKYAELFIQAPQTIQFDHHSTNDEYAQNNLVVKKASSTCEVLHILAQSQRYDLTEDILKLIYAGIITDTNNLTQGVITVRTHKIISDMIQKGVNVEALNDHFFKNNTKSKAYLLKQALDSLTFYAGERIAFMKLTKQDLAECDATFEDTMGIVNQGIEIKGVDIAVLAIKQEDNSYYVSLRGKNNVNVAQVAIELGGGGSDKVAAFRYNGLLADLKDQLIKSCKTELANHPIEDYSDQLFGSDEDILD